VRDRRSRACGGLHGGGRAALAPSSFSSIEWWCCPEVMTVASVVGGGAFGAVGA
jgi:hypothetical protein